MKNINLFALTRSLKKVSEVIERYHITIITLLVLGALIGVVANVNAILSQAPDEDYRTQAEQKSLRTNFDEATLKSINQLKQRQENGNFELPSGRNNPFTE